MKDILGRIKTWAKSVKWADLALVLVYGLLVLAFAKDVGDTAMFYAAYLVLRFIVNKWPKKA